MKTFRKVRLLRKKKQNVVRKTKRTKKKKPTNGRKQPHVERRRLLKKYKRRKQTDSLPSLTFTNDKANAIYQELRPNLKYNSEKELIVDGTPIPNSNVINLINNLVSTAKKPISGWKVFLQYLRRIGYSNLSSTTAKRQLSKPVEWESVYLS